MSLTSAKAANFCGACKGYKLVGVHVYGNVVHGAGILRREVFDPFKHIKKFQSNGACVLSEEDGYVERVCRNMCQRSDRNS